MFGCGSVAQVVLSRGTHGGFLTINLAFGFAVTLGILVAGQVSGKAVLHPRSLPSNGIPTRRPTGEWGGGGHSQGQGIAVASAFLSLWKRRMEKELDTLNL